MLARLFACAALAPAPPRGQRHRGAERCSVPRHWLVRGPRPATCLLSPVNTGPRARISHGTRPRSRFRAPLGARRTRPAPLGARVLAHGRAEGARSDPRAQRYVRATGPRYRSRRAALCGARSLTFFASQCSSGCLVYPSSCVCRLDSSPIRFFFSPSLF